MLVKCVDPAVHNGPERVTALARRYRDEDSYTPNLDMDNTLRITGNWDQKMASVPAGRKRAHEAPRARPELSAR